RAILLAGLRRGPCRDVLDDGAGRAVAPDLRRLEAYGCRLLAMLLHPAEPVRLADDGIARATAAERLCDLRGAFALVDVEALHFGLGGRCPVEGHAVLAAVRGSQRQAWEG